MKLVLFAYTPPPHHGQSYMVKLMLEGFGGDARRRAPGMPSRHGIECYHVNANFASGPEDMGRFRPGKLWRVARYAAEAIYCRFRHGAKAFYYAPADQLRGTVMRDWLVLGLCRPFFPVVILHWHAAGLGAWLDRQPKWFRAISRFVLTPHTLSITTSEENLPDARTFGPARAVAVPNGIPDPCPDFAARVLARRKVRLEARRAALKPGGAPAVLRILFLALGMKEKGLHDAVRGAHLAAERWRREGVPLAVRLDVAGHFFTAKDEQEFHDLVRELGAQAWVTHLGFVKGPAKEQAFADADIFCFPSYFNGESFGLVVAEALAFGLPVVTTRWRALPEFFAPGYPGIVDIKAPEQVAEAIRATAFLENFTELRERFLAHYLLDRHLDALAAALKLADPVSAKTG